ncbi:MAG: recombinase family protein [Pirellula staleyi]
MILHHRIILTLPPASGLRPPACLGSARLRQRSRGSQDRRQRRHFDKSSLFKLLTNVAYLGKVRYKEEIHEGEHDAIVPIELWEKVQKQLKHNGRTGGIMVRNKFNALLKGLVR